MNNITFRQAEAVDLARLLEIEKAAFAFPWSQHQLQADLQQGLIFVLMRDNVIIGFVILRFIANVCEILNIAILPDYQRQGFGKQLLQNAINQAKQACCEMTFLEVRALDKGTQNFYQQFGFNAIGKRKNYYPASGNKRENAIIMQLICKRSRSKLG